MTALLEYFTCCFCDQRDVHFSSLGSRQCDRLASILVASFIVGISSLFYYTEELYTSTTKYIAICKYT